jgi:glutathionyl-hydroquinone reductase
MTLADLRLLSTFKCFDAVCVCQFNASFRKVREYRHLLGYTCELVQAAAIGESAAFDHIEPF